MKAYKVVPKPMSHVTIEVEGQPRHFFDHPTLGKCQAIPIDESVNFQLTPQGLAFVRNSKSHVDLVNELIDEIEQNPPLSKGDKLAILMDCSDRLNKRWLAAWDAYKATPVNHVSRIAAFAKLDRITKANTRLTRKITALLEL